MSQENVELVYQFIDAFNRRDVESFLALCDTEVEYFSHVVELEGGGPYRGHDGIRRWWASLLAISPDFRVDIEEVRDLGDITLTRWRAHGHGAGSDVPMEQTQWAVGEWRHGKAVWGRVVLSEAEALEAAGIEE
jgi:ketosteroid isomerase-like protein